MLVHIGKGDFIMNNKVLIICESIYNDNTYKIARSMGIELNCKIVNCDEAYEEDLSKYKIIGLGSGIYYTSHHPRIVNIVEKLTDSQKVFIFSTRGAPFLGKYHNTLKSKLNSQNIEVLGEFSCRGYNCTGLYNIINGGNKGKPNEGDMLRARRLVKRILPEYTNIYIRSNKHVDICEDKCIGCGICSRCCPMGVFSLKNNKSQVANEDYCTHCNKCMEECPQKCITISHTKRELFKIAKKFANRKSL